MPVATGAVVVSHNRIAVEVKQMLPAPPRHAVRRPNFAGTALGLP